MVNPVKNFLGTPYGYANAVWRETHALHKPVYSSYEETEYAEGNISTWLKDVPWPTSTDIPKSVVLVGEAGIGKTTWACKNAIYPMMIITHIDDLKGVSGTVKTLIFDDMDFKHWPRSAQIQLVDRQAQRSIHVRYGCATIAVGVRVIFLGNEYPFLSNDGAIDRRIINLRGLFN